MNCCVNCFADQSLQSQIRTRAQSIGDCDFCENSDSEIISCHQLSESFDSLFNFYMAYPQLTSASHESEMLYSQLLSYWPGLFNVDRLEEKGVKHLVDQIGRRWEGYSDSLFLGNVMYKPRLIDHESSETRSLQWDVFAREIKEENRFFHSEKLDLEFLETTLIRFSKTYKQGHSFYRARITPEPLHPEDLGKPPKEKTTPGRANPVGIPCLYLSDQEETTLYETRVALHESISIGQFVLKAPLQVISLKDIIHYGPFEIMDRGFALDEFMRARPYLIRLEEELAKPVSKEAVNLDYLPTQYLCEYIKTMGFDAIEYKSAMKDEGFNLAVFNDRNIECIDVKHYVIEDLDYKYNYKSGRVIDKHRK